MTDIVCTWDGDHLVPIFGANAKLANSRLVVGMRYAVAVEEPRNMAMHRGYFARLHEAWQSLPDHLVEDYPTSEHLRHRALIKTGYCTMTDAVAATSAHAATLAKAFTDADKYALVQIEDRAVRIWRAESQSVRAMGGPRFKQSIDHVEGWIADLLGITPEQMARVA
jgi:hypothetical protein